MSALPSLFYSIKQEPAAATENLPILFLLHGYGGNEKSMDALAGAIPADWKVVALRAPIEISPGRFKWYTVDRSVSPIQINMGEEAGSRQAILNTIRTFSNDRSIDKRRVVLAGFSQGAIMALSCGLTSPQQVNACAVFSGRFLHEIRPYISPDVNNLRVLLAHGAADQVLSIEYAHENRAVLTELGITVQYIEDNSGHILSALQNGQFIQWLTNL